MNHEQKALLSHWLAAYDEVQSRTKHLNEKRYELVPLEVERDDAIKQLVDLGREYTKRFLDVGERFVNVDGRMLRVRQIHGARMEIRVLDVDNGNDGDFVEVADMDMEGGGA